MRGFSSCPRSSATASASRRVSTSWTGIRLRLRVAVGATAAITPSLAHPSSRRSDCAAVRSRPVNPISPNETQPSRRGRPREQRRSRARSRDRRRLVEADPAGDVDEDIETEHEPRAARDSLEIIASRLASTPRRPAAHARPAGATSDWISSSRGRAPSARKPRRHRPAGFGGESFNGSRPRP